MVRYSVQMVELSAGISFIPTSVNVEISRRGIDTTTSSIRNKPIYLVRWWVVNGVVFTCLCWVRLVNLGVGFCSWLSSLASQSLTALLVTHSCHASVLFALLCTTLSSDMHHQSLLLVHSSVNESLGPASKHCFAHMYSCGLGTLRSARLTFSCK